MEEIGEFREKVTDTSLKLRDVTEEKKAVMAAFKERTEPLHELLNICLDAVRLGFEDKTVDCYLIPDFTEDRMLFIEVATGEEVGSRRLRQSERQQNILTQLHGVQNG